MPRTYKRVFRATTYPDQHFVRTLLRCPAAILEDPQHEADEVVLAKYAGDPLPYIEARDAELRDMLESGRKLGFFDKYC